MEKRILIADDALFMRVTLKAILQSNGFTVVGEATNGEEAAQLYDELRPDLVTMDITMPICDGVTAVGKIKKMDPDAKVIMVSAMGQKDFILSAITAGAKDFIVKPFQPDSIVEKINRLLVA